MGVTGQPYTWCSCESGQRLRVEVPQYLRLCRETDKRIAPSPFAQDQATPPPPSAATADPITEADVQAAVAHLRAAKEKS